MKTKTIAFKSSKDNDLRIGTLNVRILQQVGAYSQLADALKKCSMDITAIREMSSYVASCSHLLLYITAAILISTNSDAKGTYLVH